jgi:hypothetical protein
MSTFSKQLNTVNIRLMDIFEIRKANLIRLIGSRRKGACAEKWEMAPAHLSQVLSNKTAKNLGEDVARRIEQKEGLPHGWLDKLQGDQSATSPADASHSPTKEAGGHYQTQQPQTSEDAAAAGQLLETMAALHLIQMGLFTGQLSDEHVEQILRIRNDIVHRPAKRANKAGRLQGLLASAFKADENGGSPDDLLKMYQLGMEKEFAKEGALESEQGKKPARRS